MATSGMHMPNLDPRGFWGRCQSNTDVCGAGVVVGLLTALLIVIIVWFFFLRKSERFVNPNDLPPEAAALIAARLAADPPVSVIKKERMASNREDPRLTALLN